MKVNTHNLFIYMKDRNLQFRGISRTAVNHYINYFQKNKNFYGTYVENKDFYGYDIDYQRPCSNRTIW